MATAAQIQAEIAAGPQTQDALDAALLKYSPAEMAAAFPQFGNVADFNNATREAYARVQQQQQAANRAAVRADMAARGEEFRIANPGGDVTTQGTTRPAMSAVPQTEMAASRSKLTKEQAEFIDWQMAQVNPLTGQRVADDFERQGVNPYADASRAQQQIDTAKNRTELLSQAGVSTANVAPWTDPNWRSQQQAKEDAERARADQQRAYYLTLPESQRPVVGGGGGQQTTSGYGNYLDKPMYTPYEENGVRTIQTSNRERSYDVGDTTMETTSDAGDTTTQAIKSWYDANNGKGTQADLDRWLATSGYTSAQINKALPQWSVADLDKAITAARTATGTTTPTTTDTTGWSPTTGTHPTPEQFANMPGLGTGGIGVNVPGPAGITTLITPTPTTSTPTTSTTTPATTGTTPARFNPARIQAIQQWYNSNVGRTDPQAQGDLTRFLATSGYTSGEINTALPQWGLTDLDKAIRNAQKEFKPSSKDIISTNTMPTVATGDYFGANLNVSNFGRTPFTDDLFSYFKNQSPFYYQDRPDSVERVRAIRDFYAANDGRTDPQAQSDLNRFLASGYTAREFNTALPQWGVADLEKAIGAAYKEFPRSENSSNASPTANAAQGLAALYASLNANLFDANSQTAQGAGNTGIAGLAGPA